MLRHRSLLLLASLLALGSPAPAAAITLDYFTTAYPPNPCLPLSGQPVVFSGSYCDGVACPPAPLATCATNDVTQLGAPGVLEGVKRYTRMFTFEPAANLSARIDPAINRLLGTFDTATEAGLILDYGTPYEWEPVPEALNLNFTAQAVTGVHFTIDGTMSPAQPLLVAFELLTDGEGPRPSATGIAVVTGPGPVTIPLAAFTVNVGGSPFADVDDIQIFVSNCTDYENGCPDGVFEPAQFTLGPVEFVTAPTPAVRASWGRLKAAYR